MQYQWCDKCRRRLFLHEFSWKNRKQQERNSYCPDCLATYRRKRKIILLTEEATRLVDHIEEHGLADPVCYIDTRGDPRRELFKIMSDIQWLKSLPWGKHGLKRPHCSYDPFTNLKAKHRLAKTERKYLAVPFASSLN